MPACVCPPFYLSFVGGEESSSPQFQVEAVSRGGRSGGGGVINKLCRKTEGNVGRENLGAGEKTSRGRNVFPPVGRLFPPPCHSHLTQIGENADIKSFTATWQSWDREGPYIDSLVSLLIGIAYIFMYQPPSPLYPQPPAALPPSPPPPLFPHPPLSPFASPSISIFLARWMRSGRMCFRSSRVWIRSSRVRMR